MAVTEYDQKLRAEAVFRATQVAGTDARSIVPVAQNIYDFIKGEEESK